MIPDWEVEPDWLKACDGGACVEVAWATASAGNGACVEVGPCTCGDGSVLIRDSKDPDGPHLTFTVEEWDVFVDGIRNKTVFDHIGKTPAPAGP